MHFHILMCICYLVVSISYLYADTFSSVWCKSDSTYLEFLLVTLYIFGTRNERKEAKEKSLMNEYHCVHILPQGIKDSHYKVPRKTIVARIPAPTFRVRDCSDYNSSCKPPIISLKSQPWIRDAPAHQLFTDARRLN